jgi:hypothetical protein
LIYENYCIWSWIEDFAVGFIIEDSTDRFLFSLDGSWLETGLKVFCGSDLGLVHILSFIEFLVFVSIVSLFESVRVYHFRTLFALSEDLFMLQGLTCIFTHFHFIFIFLFYLYFETSYFLYLANKRISIKFYNYNSKAEYNR